MKTDDFKLGMRVRRRSDEGSFVKDRAGSGLKGRRIGIVIGLPEPISPRHKGCAVQWEGSVAPPEVIFIHRLEALPIKEQPVALGGQWTADASTFIAQSAAART